MTTERFYEFVILAKKRNFSRAAEQLHCTQSILSRHIKEMERDLGVSLFARSTHGVELTDEGKLLLREAELLLKQERDITSLLRVMHEKTDGTVSIYCSEQTLNTQVLSFFHDFHENYPGIELAFHPISMASTKEMAVSADIFLTPCDFAGMLPDTIASLHVLDQSALLAIPPRHHLNTVQTVGLSELRDEALLVPFADETFGPYARNAFLAERATHGHIQKIAVQDAMAALLMVEMGQGSAIIPHHLKHRIYPRTRTVLISDKACRFPIYVYYNTENSNPAAELFYDAAMREFQDRGL